MKAMGKALLLTLLLLIAVPAFAQEDTAEAAAETVDTEEAVQTEALEDTEAEPAVQPATVTPMTEEEQADTEEPVLERYTVELAEAGGEFTQLSEHATVAEAVDAAKANGSTNAVVRDANRTRGNGVIFMHAGIAITAPDHIGKLLLNYNEGANASYTGIGYDAKYTGGDGSNVSILLMGKNGAVQAQGGQKPVAQVELIPPAHITAQSYYENVNGELTHVLQAFHYDSRTNRYVANSSRVVIGPAPAGMARTGRYYSYDAYRYYFNDPLTAGSVSLYHEPYYKTLPLRSITNYTAEELNRYIASWELPNSALNDTGAIFKRVQNQTGVNAAMLLSMAAHESAKGTSAIALEKNNFFGVGAIDQDPYGEADRFHSVTDSILYQAQVKINDQYLNQQDWRYRGPHVGDKDSGLNVQYASDPYWGEKIAGHMYRLDTFLGGKDADKYTIGWVRQPAYAYTPGGWPSRTVAYPLYKDGGYPAFIPVIVTGTGGEYYIARGIMPVSKNIADPTAEYDIDGSRIYIPMNAFTTSIQNPKNPTEPAPEIFVLSERIRGKDRVETSVAISKRVKDKVEHVVIANGYSEIDALSAAPLAGMYDAPILLVREDSVTDTVLSELKRLGTKNIWIVGGDAAVSERLETELKKDYTVERLSGANRYETAAVVYEHMKAKNPAETRVFLANGRNAVDAMTIGGYAAQNEIPILLTEGNTLSDGTRAAIKKARTVTLLGGNNAVSDALSAQLVNLRKSVNRIEGTNRFDTAVTIAETYYKDPEAIVLTRGRVLADGLAGFSVVTAYNAPMLLTEAAPDENLLEYLEGSDIKHMYVLGGEAAVSDQAIERVITAIE